MWKHELFEPMANFWLSVPKEVDGAHPEVRAADAAVGGT
jgi:hypothetical protein